MSEFICVPHDSAACNECHKDLVRLESENAALKAELGQLKYDWMRKTACKDVLEDRDRLQADFDNLLKINNENIDRIDRLKAENEKLVKELLETNQKHQELSCGKWKAMADKLMEALRDAKGAFSHLTESDKQLFKANIRVVKEALALYDAERGPNA